MLTAGDALAKNLSNLKKSLLGAKIWLWMLIILDDCWRCSKREKTKSINPH